MESLLGVAIKSLLLLLFGRKNEKERKLSLLACPAIRCRFNVELAHDSLERPAIEEGSSSIARVALLYLFLLQQNRFQANRWAGHLSPLANLASLASLASKQTNKQTKPPT